MNSCPVGHGDRDGRETKPDFGPDSPACDGVGGGYLPDSDLLDGLWSLPGDLGGPYRLGECPAGQTSNGQGGNGLGSGGGGGGGGPLGCSGIASQYAQLRCNDCLEKNAAPAPKPLAPTIQHDGPGTLVAFVTCPEPSVESGCRQVPPSSIPPPIYTPPSLSPCYFQADGCHCTCLAGQPAMDASSCMQACSTCTNEDGGCPDLRRQLQECCRNDPGAAGC